MPSPESLTMPVLRQDKGVCAATHMAMHVEKKRSAESVWPLDFSSDFNISEDRHQILRGVQFGRRINEGWREGNV